jgi:nickel-dependent lactate racemase
MLDVLIAEWQRVLEGRKVLAGTFVWTTKAETEQTTVVKTRKFAHIVLNVVIEYFKAVVVVTAGSFLNII